MQEVTSPPIIAPIQLYLLPSSAEWHTLNEEGEVNRSNITDEFTDGFVIQASLEKAIHGEGNNLNSFIGLRFTLEGADDKRRFKSIQITIRFEDANKPLQDDPEVVNIWPDGYYYWNEMSKGITETKSVEGQLQGGAYGATGSFGGRWERQTSYTKSTRATLSGIRTLLKRRSGAHKNAVVIRMRENTQDESGTLHDVCVGILVTRRRPGNHQFKALISIKAEADMRFDVVKGLKKLIGANHITDPVVFEPGVNFSPPDDVTTHGDGPDVKMVESYGEAVAGIELKNLRS